MRKTLRNTYRQQRQQMDNAAREHHEQALLDHLSGYIEKLQPSVLCAYLANDGEVDITPWLNAAKISKIGLPRVTGEQMNFHQWQPGDELDANQWRILEPVADAPQVKPEQIDVLLMPLVAFDLAGNRLGMGGGYYDRYLSGATDKPGRIGIAFSQQQLDELLSTESWDVPLTAVVTELGVIEFA